jgi:ribosomal protein S3
VQDLEVLSLLVARVERREPPAKVIARQVLKALLHRVVLRDAAMHLQLVRLPRLAGLGRDAHQ